MIIELPEDFCTEIELRMYEYNVARDNIVFLLDLNREDETILNTTIYKAYLQEEIKCYKAYSDIKDEIVQRYVPNECANKSWKVDFKKHQLLIY